MNCRHSVDLGCCNPNFRCVALVPHARAPMIDGNGEYCLTLKSAVLPVCQRFRLGIEIMPRPHSDLLPGLLDSTRTSIAGGLLLLSAVAMLSQAVLPSKGLAQANTANSAAQMQSSVDDLALQLRLTFRNRNSEFKSRYAILAEALDRWNQSTRSDADLRTMQAWLDDATRASIPGSRRAMPAPPEFAKVSPNPKFSGPAVEQPSLENAEPIDKASSGNASNSQRPSSEQPIISGGQTKPSIEVLPESRSVVQQRKAPARKAETPIAATKPKRTRRHPGSTPIDWSSADWSDPFVDDPLPTNPNSRIARTTRFKPASASRPAVKVNLSELSARIRGYGRALELIEADLMMADDATGFRLAGIVRELDEAFSQRELLELYLGGLSEIERMALPDMAESAETVRMLQRRVSERRQSLSGAGGAAADAELAVLDGLTRKLGQLVGE